MNEKKETKADAFARIRFYGPTAEDIANERPRVRRAALCALAMGGDGAKAMRALDAAVTDKSEVVFLATARAAKLRHGQLQGVHILDVLRSAVELRIEKMPPGTSFDAYARALDLPAS